MERPEGNTTLKVFEDTEIMDQLLTTWEQMGYSFRTLDELP